jgi:hypothetical protein
MSFVELPPDERLWCGVCGGEARIVRLSRDGIEHVLGYQRHPVTLSNVPLGGANEAGATPRLGPRASERRARLKIAGD